MKSLISIYFAGLALGHTDGHVIIFDLKTATVWVVRISRRGRLLASEPLFPFALSGVCGL